MSGAHCRQCGQWNASRSPFRIVLTCTNCGAECRVTNPHMEAERAYADFSDEMHRWAKQNGVTPLRDTRPPRFIGKLISHSPKAEAEIEDLERLYAIPSPS